MILEPVASAHRFAHPDVLARSFLLLHEHTSTTLHWLIASAGLSTCARGGEERSEPARPDEQNGGQLATQGSNIILRLEC